MFPGCFAIIAVISMSITGVTAEPAGKSGYCEQLHQQVGLSLEQRQICLSQGGGDLLLAVGKTQVADFPETCQYWMMDERWNCANISLPAFPKSFQTPNHWIHKLTKETAYVQALTAGLLLQRVVKDCSANAIPGCSCVLLSDPLPSNEQWQPCSNNVGYGIEFTQQFLDTMWRKDQNHSQQLTKEHQVSVPEQLVHLHNLESGRRAVTQNQVKKCRCHGLTTTCQLKTCNRVMPDARLIGQVLKNEYENAKEVEVIHERPSLPYELAKVDYKSTFIAAHESPFPDHTQLVYLEESPDYCNANSTYGSTGVSGRECVQEMYSSFPKRFGLCSEVCCEAGWHSEKVKVMEVCHCILNQRTKQLDCSEMCQREIVKFYCD